jgi:hypothetical protein
LGVYRELSVHQQQAHALACCPASTELFAQNLLRFGTGKLEVNPSRGLTVFQNILLVFCEAKSRGNGKGVSTLCEEKLTD